MTAHRPDTRALVKSLKRTIAGYEFHRLRIGPVQRGQVRHGTGCRPVVLADHINGVTTSHLLAGENACISIRKGMAVTESMVNYEICVRGHLGDMIRSAFPDLRAETRGRDTVLTGGFADPAALYGMLAQLEALGLELLQLRRVEL
jgi:hypothetical protein